MDKSTITFQGVDYIVRTLDIRSLPSFGENCYASVDVAEHALWEELERRIEKGDKYAVRLDNTIFFYPDTDVIKADPTDEELLDYLRKYLCGMTKFVPVSEPESFDFYAIELDDLGRKQISLLGYTYHGDKWKTIDARGVCLPLSEFIDGMEEHEDYVNLLYEGCREYERDVTDEECVADINRFFDGKPADYRLKFEDVIMETPVGNYVNS